MLGHYPWRRKCPPAETCLPHGCGIQVPMLCPDQTLGSEKLPPGWEVEARSPPEEEGSQGSNPCYTLHISRFLCSFKKKSSRGPEPCFLSSSPTPCSELPSLLCPSLSPKILGSGSMGQEDHLIPTQHLVKVASRDPKGPGKG